MENIEFGPADVFEPGEVVRYWHPGHISFVDKNLETTGKGTRLYGGCAVKIVAERYRDVLNLGENSFPFINYVVEVVSDAMSHAGPVALGTRGVVSSPHLIRPDRDDGPHACNKAGWVI